MVNKSNNVYTFVSNKVNYGVEKLNNGTIEIYEVDNPSKTGFIFDGGNKQFFYFINSLTDIAKDFEDTNYES